MEQKDFLKRFAAGVFFILCLGLVIGVVFVIGVEKGLTESKFEMTALFRKVGGLQVGAPVHVSGVTVGTVQDISFLDEEIEGRGVQVHMSLYKKYEKQLRKSSRIAVINQGVLGEKLVDITTDPKTHREDLSRPVVGVDPLEVQDLAETFGAAAESLLATSKTIGTVTHEINLISDKTRRVLDRVEQKIIDGDLFKLF